MGLTPPMSALSSRESETTPRRPALSSPERERPLSRPPDPREDVEDVLWSVARSERQASLAELYLARYPNGAHVDDAKALIASLEAAQRVSSSPELACERLATHPHDATASVNGVEMEFFKKNAEAAVQVCGEAAAAHPQIAHYEAMLARATFAAGRYDEAVRLYRKAAEANDVRAMVSLGLLLETGDPRQRTSRRPIRSTRKRPSAAAPTARSTSPSRLSRARGSTLTFLARLIFSGRPPTTARPARPTTSPRSSRMGSGASRRAKRSPSSGAPRRGLSGGLPRRGRAARRRARVAKNPSAAADDLLHAVATNSAKREPNSPEKRRSGRPKPSGSFRPGSSRLAIMAARSTEEPARRSGQR